MQLDGENALCSGSDGGRTIDAAVVVAAIPSGCHCCRRHLSLGHVVSIHLLTIDVGDNAEAIVQSDLDGSHVAQTGESSAQVLSSGDLLCSGSERNGRPRGVRKIHFLPAVVSRRTELPFRVLVDGGIQRHVDALLRSLRHHHLQRQVSIHTVDFQPSAIRPSIFTTVEHPENILAVCGCCQAGFNGSHIIVDERGRRVDHG